MNRIRGVGVGSAKPADGQTFEVTPTRPDPTTLRNAARAALGATPAVPVAVASKPFVRPPSEIVKKRAALWANLTKLLRAPAAVQTQEFRVTK